MARRWMSVTKLLVVLAMFGATACGSDDPAGPGGGGGDGDLSATIDGDEWTADLAAVATRTNNVVGIGAGDSNGDRSIGIGFIDAGPGPYPINGTTPTNALLVEGQHTWAASAGVGGSGMLTITTISATRVAGTFSFEAVPNAATGATGNRSVTKGEFDIEFSSAAQ